MTRRNTCMVQMVFQVCTYCMLTSGWAIAASHMARMARDLTLSSKSCKRSMTASSTCSHIATHQRVPHCVHDNLDYSNIYDVVEMQFSIMSPDEVLESIQCVNGARPHQQNPVCA